MEPLQKIITSTEYDGKTRIMGWAAAGMGEPDNVETFAEDDPIFSIFPDMPTSNEMLPTLDDLGRPKYILEKGKAVLDKLSFTDEEWNKVKKIRLLKELEYDTEDEIALLNSAIQALIDGKAVPQEYLDYRARVEEIKISVEGA